MAAEYRVWFGMPTMPRREPMHTIEAPDSGASGIRCFMTRNALRRLPCSTSRAAA
ncbi:hypothetical protein GCM10010309_80250 [Streptomyces violaceochromogenes]|nr:hypothetical protein GCM10010309_80250 [Streptomyces violaceochromogenes]